MTVTLSFVCCINRRSCCSLYYCIFAFTHILSKVVCQLLIKSNDDDDDDDDDGVQLKKSTLTIRTTYIHTCNGRLFRDYSDKPVPER